LTLSYSEAALEQTGALSSKTIQINILFMNFIAK